MTLLNKPVRGVNLKTAHTSWRLLIITLSAIETAEFLLSPAKLDPDIIDAVYDIIGDAAQKIVWEVRHDVA